MKLELCPVTLREASAFVGQHHRHHQPPQGGLFAIACAVGGLVLGVAIVGRPVARRLDDGFTAEVTRLCVDDALLSELTSAWAAGVWFAARERGLRGLALGTAVLDALDRCPLRQGPSMLYGAAWRAARAMGYRKIITYTLREEGGASLRGADWQCKGEAGGGSWNKPGRPRVDTHPTQVKLRWEVST